MSRTLKKQDIFEILYGVTLLGSGGGGPLKLGLKLIEETDQKSSISIELYDVDEMEDGAFGAMNAILGSPVAMEKGAFEFSDATNAFLGLQKEMKREGKNLKYIYSGEYGGLNSAVPIYTAITSDIPLVDVDSNMRAVPELNTGVLPNKGKPAYPVVLSNTNGDVMTAYTKDPEDSAAAETIARAMCMAYNMKIGFSTWAISKEDIKMLLMPGSLTYAQKAGKALLEAKAAEADIFKALSDIITCKLLGKGKVENVELAQKEGFDFGTTTIAIEKGKLIVNFKNEHMFVSDEKGGVIITVPDIVCIVDSDTYEPLTNDRIKEGQNVVVLSTPCAKMWNFPEGYDCFKHILKAMGYEGDRVSF